MVYSRREIDRRRRFPVAAFLVLGGAGFLLGLVLALTLARSTRSALAIAALGPTLAAGLLAVILVRSPDRPYHDEAEYFGFWIHPAVLYTLGFNVVGWLGGTAAGVGVRRLRPSPPKGNELRSS
jgi:hypothetical protein